MAEAFDWLVVPTMTTSNIIALIALGIMLVDACPVLTSLNGSCCEVKSNEFKFSTTALKSRVYNIINFCGDCEAVAEGYIVMLLPMEEGGWWSKEDKMVVLTLTEDG